jgi:hypothetical protein
MTEPVTVKLIEPILRGSEQITVLTLRKPTAGEFRGIKLSELLQGDQASLARLLERICDPALTPKEIGDMDPGNFVRCYGAISRFFRMDEGEDQAPA